MNTRRLLDTFSELVALDSPTFCERPVFSYLKNILEALGLTVIETDAPAGGSCGNLFARLAGNTVFPDGELSNNQAANSGISPILFSAHMDTVSPAVGKRAVFRGDGVITSAGDTVLGADDLAGVAAIVEALRSLIESELPHRTIELLFTAAEEVFCKGAAAFDYSLPSAKEVYVFDLNGPVGSAANKAPSIISFTVTITGKSAHAGLAPENGVHAIAAAAKAITQLKMGHIDENTTLNIGQIEGGAALNIVPEKCAVKGEIRSYSHEAALDTLENVRRVFELSAAELGASALTDSECCVKAYEISENSEVVRRYKNACKKLGLCYSLSPTFGGSDNNIFAEKGLSGIVASCAMHDCHTCSEYTTVDELSQISELIFFLMSDMSF